MIALDESLQKLNHGHFLRRFDGSHQWPDANLFDEALAWLRLQAMKTGRESRDVSYISDQLTLELKRAQSFQPAEPFAAWFEYRQAAETFDSLAIAPNLRAEQKSLEAQKIVLDAAKAKNRKSKNRINSPPPFLTVSLRSPNQVPPTPLRPRKLATNCANKSLPCRLAPATKRIPTKPAS
jgi:hypothetical protein